MKGEMPKALNGVLTARKETEFPPRAERRQNQQPMPKVLHIRVERLKWFPPETTEWGVLCVSARVEIPVVLSHATVNMPFNASGIK